MTEDDFLPPRFDGTPNFNAQHPPMGAFMSFTCGHFGTGGGIGVEIGKPASQNVFIGVKRGGRRSKHSIVCLPFAKDFKANAAADYQVEQSAVAPAKTGVSAYAPHQVQRHYGWATDAWVTPDFTFSVFSPFGPIPEPGVAPGDVMRAALLPAVVATLTIDNRKGIETKTAVFALGFNEPGTRMLTTGDDDSPSSSIGFAWRRSMGVLATVESNHKSAAADDLFAFQRWSVAEGVADVNPIHALGSIGGVGIEVPPGECRTIVLAIGAYLGEVVTTGLDGRYFYTRHYSSLEDVLATALVRARELRAEAARLDRELLDSGLSHDQQFLIAHATRSYYGSTQLLDIGGEPFWIVNEGEYCMMNTLDLSVDQMFWELDRNPWVVRNLLDSFARRYSYVDSLQAGTKTIPGGLSFAHDMGVNNNFSPPGYSSYELPHLTGCFSYMTAEQLCNWILIAATYVSRTGDAGWAKRNRHLIDACGESLLARCGKSGVIQYDSDRCEGGAEITTYDSLDHSLAQTRNNLYIATKCWASFLALDQLVKADGDRDDRWAANADAAAQTVRRHIGPDGVIPAVFERDSSGYASRILPACEALIYPLYWSTPSESTAALREVLRRHTRALLLDAQRRNLFADGGIKLSSTSNNSWMSKIAIFQFVARQVLGFRDDAAVATIFAAADAAHLKWQTVGSAYWACSDQFVSGEAKGSRYYPRIITAALWLDERPASAVIGVEHALTESH